MTSAIRMQNIPPPAPRVVTLYGACRGTATVNNGDINIWFASAGQSQATKRAKAICNSQCPVRKACKEWALREDVHPVYGTWGGMSENQRNEEMKKRRAERAEQEARDVA